MWPSGDRKRALARLHLRHVNRVFALGVARKDQVATQARADVLHPAVCAGYQAIDEELVARGAELVDEVEILFVFVLRFQDDVLAVAAADGTCGVFEHGVALARRSGRFKGWIGFLRLGSSGHSAIRAFSLVYAENLYRRRS